VETVESAIQAQVKEEIARTFREGDKAMMVHGGGNKAGRFLEVSFLAVGGRKGVIWLPEGRFGNGWRRFAGEFRRLLEAQRLAAGSEGVGDSSAKVVSGSSAPGVDRKRSYVQALCATPAVEEKAAPSRDLDLFPVLSQFESRTIGEDLRVAVDCAALEGARLCSMEAAGSAGASDLGVKVEGLKKLLGLLDFKLDRVITGLSLRPTRWRRKKFRVVGLDYAVVRKTGSVIDENMDLGLERCVGSGLDQEVLDPGLDPGFDLASDLKPVSCPWLPGDPSGCAATQDSSTRVPELLTESLPIPPELSPISPERSPEFIHDSGSGSPGTHMENPPDLLGCSPEFTLTQGSGAEASTVEAVIGVVGDMSVQEEGYIGELQVHSSRSPELLTEKPPTSPERSPELLRMVGSGVDEIRLGSDPPSLPEVVLNSPPAALSLSPLTALGEIYGSVGMGSTSGELSPGSGASPAYLLRRTGEVSPSSAVRRSSPVSSPIMSVFQLVMEEGPSKFDRNHTPVSSATQLRLGAAKLSDPRLASDPIILEAFTLPWEDDSPDSEGEDSDFGVADPDIELILEVDFGVADPDIELISEVCSAKDVRDPPQDKTARIPSPALGLIKRGFLGPRAAHPAPVKVDKKPAQVRSDSLSQPVVEGSDSEAVLGRGISQPSHVNSSVSKSQRGYAQRVKEKVAKQSNKNKELLAEIVVDVPVVGEEGYSKRVLEAMKCAPVVGMTWGGDDKKLLDTFSAMENKEPKVKGLRELKNLDCSLSPVKSQHRRGVGGSKYARSFPPEIH
jgi:hypothetical protein